MLRGPRVALLDLHNTISLVANWRSSKKVRATYRVEVRRLSERSARLLFAQVVVYMQQPFLDVRVVMANHFEITLEGRVVGYIEADNCRVSSVCIISLLQLVVAVGFRS